MKKIFISLLASLTLILVISPQFSFAEKPELANVNLSKEDKIKGVKEHYKNPDVANVLINKIKKQELFDSVNPEKKHLGISKKIDKYTTLITYPDGSEVQTKIDFSDASFYDENGPISESSFTTLAVDGISGGTWSSGTGYKCVKGVTVESNAYSQFGAKFNADFCNNAGTYDNISRIYGVYLWSDNTFEIVDDGVFRGQETFEYSAYGGVKFNVSFSPDSGTSTESLYLRVGSDTYWYVDTY